jgi:mRNA interferase MazF
MAITSQIHSTSNLGEVGIEEWQAANLLKPSAIKPVFATLEQTLILKRLGTLEPPTRGRSVGLSLLY